MAVEERRPILVTLKQKGAAHAKNQFLLRERRRAANEFLVQARGRQRDAASILARSSGLRGWFAGRTVEDGAIARN
jgi:hypothetical protein